MTLYLKKQADIDLLGDELDSSALNLTPIITFIDFGDASKVYNTIGRIGDGQKVRGGIYTKAREIKTSLRYFDRLGYTLTGFRDEIIYNWLNSIDDIYLYRQFDNGNVGKVKVFLTLNSGEVYNDANTMISEELELNMLCENPFFEALEETEISVSKTTSISTLNIQNDSAPVFFQLSLNLTSSMSYLSIRTFENVGIDINTAATSGTTIDIDTKDFSIKYDDVSVVVSKTGSPFRIESGSNTIRFDSDSNFSGTITYKEAYV